MVAFMMLAHAELPPAVPLRDAVRQADAIVVGKPVRVEFQALDDGETWSGNTLHAFWIEYQVYEPLKGSIEAGKVIRVVGTTGGCEKAPWSITRNGSAFHEVTLGHSGPLDPARWVDGRLQMLVLSVDGEGIRHVAHNVSPLEVTTAVAVKVRDFATR